MDEYTAQLEQTVESLKKKLEDASYFKPMWCQAIVPGPGNGKMWVLQIQGNPVDFMYEKKIASYRSGSHTRRANWAESTVPKEIMCVVTMQPGGRCIPQIFGYEHKWQPNLEACKKYVNKILFGVEEI
jgi:hypothetical protein